LCFPVILDTVTLSTRDPASCWAGDLFADFDTTPVSLLFFIGDPDLGVTYRFKRVSSEGGPIPAIMDPCAAYLRAVAGQLM
jgi:hypothetical protein